METMRPTLLALFMIVYGFASASVSFADDPPKRSVRFFEEFLNERALTGPPAQQKLDAVLREITAEVEENLPKSTLVQKAISIGTLGKIAPDPVAQQDQVLLQVLQELSMQPALADLYNRDPVTFGRKLKSFRSGIVRLLTEGPLAPVFSNSDLEVMDFLLAESKRTTKNIKAENQKASELAARLVKGRKPIDRFFKYLVLFRDKNFEAKATLLIEKIIEQPVVRSHTLRRRVLESIGVALSIKGLAWITFSVMTGDPLTQVYASFGSSIASYLTAFGWFFWRRSPTEWVEFHQRYARKIWRSFDEFKQVEIEAEKLRSRVGMKCQTFFAN